MSLNSVIQLFSYSVKWLFGGLGWFLGGPLGGVIGFISGAILESFFIRIKDKKASIGDFAINLLKLFAAVMKADGTVVKPELDYVKRFLKLNFGESKTLEALGVLKEMLKQDIPLNEVCFKIKNNLDQTSRSQLAGFLYNLAKVDGNITETEQAILNIINNNLGVTKKQFTEPFVEYDAPIITTAYKTLGINRTASADDVKKAYRKLANKCHPDKVAFLGEDLKKSANEQFQKLTNAYEIIKKEKKL